jgi:hypothetical protein
LRAHLAGKIRYTAIQHLQLAGKNAVLLIRKASGEHDLPQPLADAVTSLQSATWGLRRTSGLEPGPTLQQPPGEHLQKQRALAWRRLGFENSAFESCKHTKNREHCR